MFFPENLPKLPTTKSFAVACVGSRKLSAKELEYCGDLGGLVAKNKLIVASGNAQGADQAFEAGALQENGFLHLYLPWPKYENNSILEDKNVKRRVVADEEKHNLFFEEASEVHPSGKYLKQGAKKLHARNGMIIRYSKTVIAFPGKDLRIQENGKITGGGGTAQAFRLALKHQLPLFDLRDREDRDLLMAWLGATLI